MSKVTLNDLASLENQTSAIATINDNYDTIVDAFDNTLSLDGTSPNEMGANLDMNNHRILNLLAPVDDTEPVRLGDLPAVAAITGVISSLTPVTTNSVVRWNGTSGSLVKDSLVIIDDSGNVSGVGTLAASGAATLAAISCTTLSASGAASLGSTLAVTGNVSVNTNKFNVTASNGNTTVAGTLGVTGASTLAALSCTTLAASSNATVGGTLGVTGVTTLGNNLLLGTGSATITPLRFTAGPLNTTPTTGVFEYDGVGFYATAVASSRQILPATMFTSVVTSDVSLSNSSTSAQSVFNSSADVLQLAASTTYFFEGLLFIATGTTSHTTAFGLAPSSAVSAIRYRSALWSTTSGTISTTAPSILDVSTTNATVLNAASTAAFTTIYVQGMIRTNAATTITPQITFSAGPTGTCATKTESYFKVWAAGSNSVESVGNWA